MQILPNQLTRVKNFAILNTNICRASQDANRYGGKSWLFQKGKSLSQDVTNVVLIGRQLFLH